MATKGNETKVKCPVCGSEFVIGEHEHEVKNATVIGKDSGIGTIYLPVSKRGETLKAAGIDTSKYFSIELPNGGTQMIHLDDDGKVSLVDANDTIVQAIMKQGTVPNRNLFRRWIMSQVFHGLGDDMCGFSNYIKSHGYEYQWKMLIEELRVQAKLYGKDMENFNARNRWFDKDLCMEMANDYIIQLRNDANSRPRHKCKGVPYITLDHKHYFLEDIEKKLISPMCVLLEDIMFSDSPNSLYLAVRNFWKHAPYGYQYYNQCVEWRDAYKGMGAYATMQNLLLFHNCSFPKNNNFYNARLSGVDMLENAAKTYCGEGWRLFGLMKQMIEENNIDISGKIKEWSDAKRERLNR